MQLWRVKARTERLPSVREDLHRKEIIKLYSCIVEAGTSRIFDKAIQRNL